MVVIGDYIHTWLAAPFDLPTSEPWEVTQNAVALISKAFDGLGRDFQIRDGIAIHRSATIEPGAILKPPVLIGMNCFVASSAYLRGGVFMGDDCIVGPACELKTVFMLEGSKIAHLSFVGDSIIGARVNIEAGAIVANFRNEMADKSIRILCNGRIVETGVDKFGSLIGDDAKIGANAVIAPGAILERGFRLGRLEKVDLHPESQS